MSDEKDKSVARESASARLPKKGKVCAGLLSARATTVKYECPASDISQCQLLSASLGLGNGDYDVTYFILRDGAGGDASNGPGPARPGL